MFCHKTCQRPLISFEFLNKGFHHKARGSGEAEFYSLHNIRKKPSVLGIVHWSLANRRIFPVGFLLFNFDFCVNEEIFFWWKSIWRKLRSKISNASIDITDAINPRNQLSKLSIAHCNQFIKNRNNGNIFSLSRSRGNCSHFSLHKVRLSCYF